MYSSSNTTLLPRSMFTDPVVQAARALLGARLTRLREGRRASVLICEVEAYDGEQDMACHAHSGQTKRNAVMYGPPGYAYIYFTYGMHWLLNCVTGVEGYPAAVLIRAALPYENPAFIAANRPGVAAQLWLAGPARLTRALGIDGTLNGADLCSPGSLFLEHGFPVAEEDISITPRIGVDYAPEPWKSMPWRFTIRNAQTWQVALPAARSMV